MLFKFLFFFQNDAELFGKTVRCNLAKPMKVKEGYAKAGELLHSLRCLISYTT